MGDMKVRSKHNDLMNYFMHDARDLSPAYVASCRKFFDSICWPRYYGGGPDLDGKIFRLKKPQASSVKQSPQLKGIKNYES